MEFADPADEGGLIKADLTWLTSRWSCIYGSGCAGIDRTLPEAGCCALGAHFSDEDDRTRVMQAAQRLGPQQWQFAGQGLELTETDADGEQKTAAHDGGCVFLNRADFFRGPGCALHLLAADEEVSFVTTKPDVCWQLPIRREYEHRNERDGTELLVTVISEYTRAGWGPGGHNFDWYCSANTEAHGATDAVYISGADELTELIGAAAYQVLVEHCQAHLEDQATRRRNGLPVLGEHPATTAARTARE